MSVGPLAVEILVVCCLAAYLLHRYGNWRKQHVLVTLAAFISWYFSLLIIVILPLDVSSTFYRQCVKDASTVSTTPVPIITTPVINGSNLLRGLRSAEELADTVENSTQAILQEHHEVDNGHAQEVCSKPWSYVPPHILPTLWRIIYWTSQVLTWLVLPMMQSYANAGDFSVAGKMKSALIENAIFYGSYLAIFVVCLIYVAVRPDINIDGSQLKVLAITASNTWGLFLLVLLLGYGLVEVPRTLWHNSKRGQLLQYTYFKIAKLSTEKSEAEENLEDVLDDVKKAADTIRYNHPMRKHVDTILLKCPETVQSSVKRNMDDYEDYNNPTETPTVKSLVRLHKKVINCSQTYKRSQCQWNMLMESAFELEDISLNEVSTKPQYIRSFGKYEGIFTRCYNPTVEWYWKCLVRPWVLKVLAVLLAIYTGMVVWSECLFFVKEPVFSLFAVFINLAKTNYDYFSIEIVSCMTILYLCVCAYYTVFKIRVFNYYYLASHHQTDENSLLFCGMLLCRLTPPLCLNFLGLIHLDSHITDEYNLEETSYTHIMGHMDVIPFISNGFNIYFPILILLLCAATYFRLGSRVLTFLGFQQFIGDDDMAQELTDEGKELVKRERRKRQRQEDGEARRRTWQEKFGDSSNKETSNPYRDTPPYRDRENDTESKYNSRPGRYGGRSPQETDRLELLRSAEPVDYTGDETILEDFTNAGRIDYTSETSGGYQSQPARASGRFNPTETRGTRPPPRDIFDDV